MRVLNNPPIFKLPKSLYFAWLLREDARKGCSINDTEAQKDFLIWWLLHGEQEYPQIVPLNDEMRAVLFEPLAAYPQYGYFGVSRLLYHIYSTREDIQALFKLDNKADIIELNHWFYLCGLREHNYLHLLNERTLAHLNQPLTHFYPAEKNSTQLPLLSPLMFFVFSLRTDLQVLFDLDTCSGREHFLGWFFLEGVYNLDISALLTDDWINNLEETVELGQQIELKRLPYLAWKSRVDLQQAFDIKTSDGRQALIEWAKSTVTQSASCQWLKERRLQQKQSLGVNLIGFAFGELGIGEDLRMAAAACDEIGIPYTVINISPGNSVRENDRILASAVAKDSNTLHSINIFCLTGFDNVRAYVEQGASLFDNHYNIGWWPWELPVWPEQWLAAFEVIDEVWAAATYTQIMYKNATDKPVTLMPLPVSVERAISVSRKEMGLPENTFLFLYVFDFNSYLERKNPQAAVNAFIKAFPKNDFGVGLVLKTMNSDPDNPQWQAFKALSRRDERIIILEKTLDREKVLGLIDSCDAYLSLHRAEGFGRTPAEAMLFGKPVIATDFSGTADFVNQQTGLPVRWQKKTLKEGDYPFITEKSNAYWAEPDINHAAEQMQLALKAGHNKIMQDKTRQFALQQFSLSRIGKLIEKRLREIKNNE
jgi:glycosyltransferase involved in cell wall biosynthesis